MNNSRLLELWVGIFVALGIAALLMLAMNVSSVNTLAKDQTYEIKATFDNVSGLTERSAVNIAGVTVGRVARISVDPVTFEAEVVMAIDKRYGEIPTDTAASIFTSGLLGEKYVGLEPGGSPDVLADGDQIRLTQSALVLEQLIGKFLFSQGESKE